MPNKSENSKEWHFYYQFSWNVFLRLGLIINYNRNFVLEYWISDLHDYVPGSVL